MKRAYRVLDYAKPQLRRRVWDDPRPPRAWALFTFLCAALATLAFVVVVLFVLFLLYFEAD